MGLYTKLPDAIDKVVIVIAGGGTAGCVVTSRLADADPELSILVIEGGPNNETPNIEYPACFLAHLMPDSKTNLFYMTQKSPAVADRMLLLATGGVLGGGSSTNMMMYSRAQRSDWDSWETPGWSADEMLPYLRKTYHGRDNKGVHGHDGPIHVSRGTWNSPRIENEFISAAEKVGWSEVHDLSDLESSNAVWRAQRFISPDGKRQDAASCYVHPRLRSGKHPNLHVLVESQVTRVLIENKRAVGVEIVPTPRFHPDSADQPLRSVKARKLVIASCGACGTPALLERSGVGDPKVLDRAGVPVVADLPGVGNSYEDHHLLARPYLNNLTPADTLDGLVFGRMGSYEDLLKTNNKMLGWNGQEVQGKVRPTEAEVAALGPDFQKAWDREFRDHPDKPLVVFSVMGGQALSERFPGDPRLATGDPCLSVTAFTVYPFSRKHIHITGPKLDDPVDFVTGFFADEGQLDIKKHIWMYKKQREVIRRMPSYRGEMAQCHPPFAAESGAACVKLPDCPLAADAPDIEYSAEDDAVLEKWLRENVSTTWHSLGTCKMLPRDQMGVVDASLGVYGVQNLKIADLSIAPRNVAANTNNTALAVGERAADIFIKELGLGST
ncbi:Alcohol oxidase [Cytospora mali]|uniref:Alcohol oxidase n=1 Tax=Cytospora mali TaxID=578113 RepID=A0A194V5J1_CYTMA|nr:Alcohol oxidase [Valsa mali var. pyri (nom. inval.)]